MLNAIGMNYWIIGPAIGFGLFLIATIIFGILQPSYRTADNISFLVFVILLLCASIALVLVSGLFKTSFPSSSSEAQAPIPSILFAGFTLLTSLSYYLFVQIETSRGVQLLRLFAPLAVAGAGLAVLHSADAFTLFSAYRIASANVWYISGLLISGGYFAVAGVDYFREEPGRFIFFGVTPFLLLVGFSLNPLFLGPASVSALSLWLVYLGLLYTTVMEALLKPHIARARQVEALNQELVDAYDTTLEGWAKALELHDKETVGHSRRVTGLCIRLAEALAVPEKDLQDIRFGALLHDIGKMALPDSILKKPGPLNPEERSVVNKHPIHAYQMLKDIRFLEKAILIPLYHHERWDGSGYPKGLAGEDIPLSARIFAVVDVWDAVTSKRPYSDPWTEEDARAYFLEERGKSFDPQVVDIFLRDVVSPQT